MVYYKICTSGLFFYILKVIWMLIVSLETLILQYNSLIQSVIQFTKWSMEVSVCLYLVSFL